MCHNSGAMPRNNDCKRAIDDLQEIVNHHKNGYSL
jgi:hypothetical protein